jgi:histidine triad (HIT) family protein
MSDCLFCKIRDGQLPAKVIYRDELCLAFDDINPEAPMHVLVVPLKHIATLNDLALDDRETIGQMHWAAAKLARERGYGDSGYRTLINCNRDGGQRVFHVHMHVLAGRPLDWPPG